MKFKATEEQILQIGSNAVNASAGGHYWPADTTTRIQITRETLAHDSGYGDKALTTRGLSLDYVAGRMVKLHIRRIDANTWEMCNEPSPGYQSWCRQYPTNEALVLSVLGKKP